MLPLKQSLKDVGLEGPDTRPLKKGFLGHVFGPEYAPPPKHLNM